MQAKRVGHRRENEKIGNVGNLKISGYGKQESNYKCRPKIFEVKKSNNE